MATTLDPWAFSICTARVPTPPEAPATKRSFSPFRSCPVKERPDQAASTMPWFYQTSLSEINISLRSISISFKYWAPKRVEYQKSLCFTQGEVSLPHPPDHWPTCKSGIRHWRSLNVGEWLWFQRDWGRPRGGYVLCVGSGLVTNSISYCWSFTMTRIGVESVFSTIAQSRFASAVFDSVLGPPCPPESVLISL